MCTFAAVAPGRLSLPCLFVLCLSMPGYGLHHPGYTSCQTKATDQKPGTAVADMAITSKPLTVDVTLDEGLRDRILAASKSTDHTIRLTIRGVAPPAGTAIVGFDVFLNKPDADQTTPTDDVHYVGAVAFQPTGEGVVTQAFVLDLNAAVRQTMKSLPADKPLRITIVPIGDSIPAAASVPLREVAVTVVKSNGK